MSADGSVAEQFVGELEERHDRAMALAGRLAVGDDVASYPELAGEGCLESLDQRRVALDPAERLRHPDRPTDLGTGEEPLAADVERDPGRAHRALDGRQLGVGPDEDSHRPVRGPGSRERPDRGGHPGQLRLIGREAADLGRRTGRQAGDQPFRWSRRGVGSTLGQGRAAGREDPVGQAQDLRRRPVVGLEPDDPRRRVSSREPDEIVARGAGERVDRLVLVADDREVVAAAEPRLEQRGLQRVGVLEFVHREPAISVAHLGRDGVVTVDEPDRPLEHVLEIDPPGARLGILVAAIEAGHQVRRQRRVAVLGERAGLVFAGSDSPRLGPFDLGREVAHREIAIAAGKAGGEWRQDRRLRGEDLGRIRAVDAWPEMAELAERRGVERGRRDAAVPERGEPAGHLARGLVGERDDKDVARPHDPSRERIGHSSRDDPGLAAAGSGEDAQRAGGDRHGLALRRIEVGQEVVGVRDWHPAILAAGAAPRLTSGSGARRSSRWPRSRSLPDSSHRRSPRRESLSSRVPSASCTPGVARPETT